MGKRYRVLTDEIFKNSKYINTINNVYGIKDFKKEYKAQYDIILDIFKTFILLNNTFFSDSNISNYDKVENAINLLEKMFMINDDENVVGVKYSVRDIKELCDKYARHLYNVMGEWYYSLYNISSKDLDDSKILKKLKKDIEEEMNKLEYSGFDNSLIENIQFERNVIKNYKNYTKYISKFDTIYTKRNEFIEDYKAEFKSLYGITLNDNDINKFGLLFKLLSSVNNGLINIINNYELDNCNINSYTESTTLYKYYLKTLNIDYKSNDFIDNSQDFIFLFGIIKNKIDSLVNYDNKKLLENFDMYFFYLTMEQTIYSHKIKFKTASNISNKLTTDLVDIYKSLKKIRESEKDLSKESIVSDYLIPMYKRIDELIKRYSNVFERIS